MKDIAILYFQNGCQWRPPFEINIKTENYKRIISQSMHTHMHLANVIFVYYVNNHFME